MICSMEKLVSLPENLGTLYDAGRLAALDEACLLDTESEYAFDRLTHLASRLLNAPVALVSLVTTERQFFKSAVGLPVSLAAKREISLSHSFCKHVVHTGEPLVIDDAREYSLVSANLAIRDFGVVAYCGVPLTTSAGFVLGSFCVIDGDAREWTATDVRNVTDLAALVMTEVELRAQNREAQQRIAQLEEYSNENQRLQRMQEAAETAQALLVARDISLRRDKEMALQESEERYRKAIAGVGGAVYEYNADTRSYNYLDPQIERIMGYSVEAITPELWKQIGRQNRLRGILEGQDFHETNRQFRAGKLDYWTADYQYLTAQGELRWVSDASVPMRDETGRVCGSLGILQDITDRIHTEEELRESEERFRALADSAPVLIWMADVTGKTTYFNRQWLRYTGRTIEQEIGYGWAEGLHTEDLLPCRQVVTTAWETRSEYRMEYRLGRADGTFGWILETGSPRFAQDGAFLGYIGSCVDVQEQKQALEAVQLSESRLNAAQKMARIGTWEYNPESGLIAWSDETYRIYGLTPGQPTPTLEQHIEGIHPDDRQRWKQIVFQSIQTGQPYEFEFTALLPNGVSRTVRSHGECRIDADGRVSAMWGTSQDITERIEAQQERTRLLEILEATPDYVAVTDLKGRLLYLNRTGRDILDLANTEIKEHDIRERFTPSAASLILNVGMPTAQRDGIWMGETIIQAADGRKIPMLQMIQAHRNAEGEPQYFSTIGRDITERKRSEEESLRNLRDAAVREAMAKRNQELQALSRRLVEVQEAERTHIARELHDEIGQNLTGLKLTLGAIPRLGEEGKERNLKLALELTTELMGQVRAMSLDLRPGMLDDLGLLPALQWHLDRYTTQTGVSVEFEEEGLRDRRFNRASETAAYRIVQEALTNVARYADIKAARVRVRVVRDKLHLSIVDQGTGFEPEIILAAGRSNGLAGMRERALLLGGTFGIQSSPGAGTRLMAELPL